MAHCSGRENPRYREILESARVQRFYLNEMGESAQQLPGVGLMCLAVEPEIGSRARDVLAQARAQGGQFYDQVLELVEKTLCRLESGHRCSVSQN
ncbi:DUF2887 domain-containing protein [Anthocerotibacter panamensis]|uniref:DUF2887 domain-containing protein n=1 Tax=Anthocerotibacter panamensis TaxID=2857077 RepID=UPI001C404C6E|nr:DUF2887 domain-containing protein [Anthocerotibacter panamensis]